MFLQKFTFILLIGSLAACAAPKSDKNQTSVPTFCADSAYRFVQQQVDFGARVPGTEAHDQCADFLANTLQRFGAEVERQHGESTLYSGETMAFCNIIGRYNVQATQRILLCAHWDSRPFADHDPNPENWHKPVLGANDGASGVGVLLEVARQLQLHAPKVGVDLVFFDLEDWGTPEFYNGEPQNDSWCLGSQHWAREAKKNGYRADFGILLDMVGGQAAHFAREQISAHFAPSVVNRVWETAQSLGFGNYFVDSRGGAVTDDHYYINTIAKIPCIDIIDYDLQSGTGFVGQWHTTDDTMQHIDRNSLLAVGQTLLCLVN